MRLFLIALALLLASPAAAQYYDQDQLAKVDTVGVLVSDGVSGGCLPQPGALKNASEQILRDSGVKLVGPDAPGAHVLAITATGGAIGNTGACVASLLVELARWERLADGTGGVVASAEASNSLFVGPKDTLQQQLRQQVSRDVTALANELTKARSQ